MNSRNKRVLSLIIIIVILVSGIFYFVGRQNKVTVKNHQIAPTVVLIPTIKIISPKGGEVWIEGKTYDITWDSLGIEKISISAVMGGHDLGEIAVGINATADRYSWTIPLGKVSSFGQSSSNNVRIRIEDDKNPNIYSENQSPFTITSAN